MISFYDILQISFPATGGQAGRSISVVQVVWDHLGWVRLPAARHCGISLMVK